METRGGGSAKMWSSMLEKNLVWNGGSKMENLCGIVWTQNGGEICKSGCDMGIKIKMTQNVCGMGCFLTKKAHVPQRYFQKVLELCGMGALSVTPFTEKMCGVAQHCVEWGVYPRWKSTQYGSFRIFIFEHATTLFGWDTPPGLFLITLVAQGPLAIFFPPLSFSSGLVRGTYKMFNHG